MNYTLDEPLNYSLLIPSFEAGIKIGKKGKLYADKQHLRRNRRSGKRTCRTFFQVS